MSRFDHVPEDLLAAFVEGDVDEQVAVHIAEHLDDCPACATCAATMEPLASVFARSPDPVAPEGLVEAVLAEAMRPEPGPGTELVVGASLIVAALLLTVLAGDAGRSVVAIGVFVDGLGRVADHFGPGLTQPLLLAMLAAAVGGLAWHNRKRSALVERRIR